MLYLTNQNNKKNRLWFLQYVLGVIAVILMMTGCTDDRFGEAPEMFVSAPVTPEFEIVERDTLTISYWDAPTILNPHLSTAIKDLEASRITYEPLASYDKNGNLVPILAEKIPSIESGTVAEDGLSVSWTLKQDIQWADGTPFSVDDVIFTYEFATNPEVGSDSAPNYDTIETIEVVDDHTIILKFKAPNPAWSIPFVGARGSILPKHLFEDYNGANAKEAPANIIPVGTGPYRVNPPGIKPQEILFLGTQLVETNKIVFEKNPYFREEGKPYFDQIIVRGGGTPNESARQVLLLGEVDYASNLTLQPEELARYESNAATGRTVANFGATVEQVDLNRTDPNRETAEGERSSLEFGHPAFDELLVRQAIAHAINRQSIAELYGASGEITQHILVSPPQFKSDNRFYDFDLDKAMMLLDEAGWVDSDGDGIRDKDGQKLSLVFQTIAGSPVRQETWNIIQASLEAIGIDAELKLTDISIFYGADVSNPNHILRFRADMQAYDWTSISPDPGLFLQYWTCEQIPQKDNGWSGFNVRRWCNPEYDTLFEQSKTELDPNKRREIFVELNDMISEDVVLIPLVRQARIAGVSNSLEGFDPTPWDSETWNIKEWRRSE